MIPMWLSQPNTARGMSPVDVTEIKVDCFSIAMYGDSGHADGKDEANEDHVT